MDEFWKKYSDGFFFTKGNAIFFFSFLGFISVCTINNQYFYNLALDEVRTCLIALETDRDIKDKPEFCLRTLRETFW